MNHRFRRLLRFPEKNFHSPDVTEMLAAFSNPQLFFNPNSEIGRREMAQDVEGKSLAEKFGVINSLR
jgi:hypothetical protein